jgi:hypothetical protein
MLVKKSIPLIALCLAVNFLAASTRVTLPGILEPFDLQINKDQIFISEKESVYTRRISRPGKNSKSLMTKYISRPTREIIKQGKNLSIG